MRTLSIIMVMLCVMFKSAGINADYLKEGETLKDSIDIFLKIDADTIENSDEQQNVRDLQKFFTSLYSGRVAKEEKDYPKERKIFITLADEIQRWPEDKKNDLKRYGIDGKMVAGGIYYHLGIIYHDGRGRDPDYSKAIHFYTKAIVEEGNYSAINELATMYWNGQGVEPNVQKAGRLFLLGAQQGDPLAQINFGQILFVEKRIYEEAYYWYNLAKTKEDELLSKEPKPSIPSKGWNPLDIINTQMDTMESRLDPKTIKDLQDLTGENWKSKQFKYGYGSGFYITKEYIVTNAHVVCSDDIFFSPRDSCDKFDEVRIPDYRLSIEKIDTDVDLALLKVVSPRKDSSSAKIRSSSDLQLGEHIAVFGYPLAEKLSFAGNFTIGNVSAREGRPTGFIPSDFFQFTAPIQRGNSGSPVLDAAGNVVGVAKERLL